VTPMKCTAGHWSFQKCCFIWSLSYWWYMTISSQSHTHTCAYMDEREEEGAICLAL
jgi:hypothetical protein